MSSKLTVGSLFSPEWREDWLGAGAAPDGGERVFGRGSPWVVEPSVGRVADGLSDQVDRLRCLGNAVVPEVAYYVGMWILAVEYGER